MGKGAGDILCKGLPKTPSEGSGLGNQEAVGVLQSCPGLVHRRESSRGRVLAKVQALSWRWKEAGPDLNFAPLCSPR